MPKWYMKCFIYWTVNCYHGLLDGCFIGHSSFQVFSLKYFHATFCRWLSLCSLHGIPLSNSLMISSSFNSGAKPFRRPPLFPEGTFLSSLFVFCFFFAFLSWRVSCQLTLSLEHLVLRIKDFFFTSQSTECIFFFFKWVPHVQHVEPVQLAFKKAS